MSFRNVVFRSNLVDEAEITLEEASITFPHRGRSSHSSVSSVPESFGRHD